MGAKIRFRLAYLGFPVAVFAVWHAANWIIVGPQITWRQIGFSPGVYAATNVALVIWCIVAGILIITVCRLYQIAIGDRSAAKDIEETVPVEE